VALSAGNVYTGALNAFLAGGIDLTADPITAQLAAGFAFDDTDTAPADITGTAGTALAVPAPTISAGGAWLNTALVFPTVPAGAAITAVVFAVGGLLLCHIGRRADTVPLHITPAGQDITLQFGQLLRL
jgi:hypothetical protein